MGPFVVRVSELLFHAFGSLSFLHKGSQASSYYEPSLGLIIPHGGPEYIEKRTLDSCNWPKRKSVIEHNIYNGL